jgi:hypothetical protein
LLALNDARFLVIVTKTLIRGRYRDWREIMEAES